VLKKGISLGIFILFDFKELLALDSDLGKSELN